MKNAKTIGIVVAAVLVAIVVLQNTQTATTRILFFTIEMPRAVLLFVTLLIGFVLGLLARRRVGGKPAAEDGARP